MRCARPDNNVKTEPAPTHGKLIPVRDAPPSKKTEMATTALDRLLFAQGGDCFFCHQNLPREEASVEHLVASTLGGSDNDENCVACCKTLNRLFGRMSLKEKMQLLLKQRGDFQCPARYRSKP